jgi:hypothetical protein
MSPRRREGLTIGLTALVLALAGCGGSSTSSTTTQSTSTPSTATSPTVSSTATTTTPAVTTTSGSSHTVSVSSGGVTATMHAGTHAPKVEAPWPIHFTVTRSGQPVAAGVSYEYMFGGQVVAHRSHYNFKGHFSDVFKWPSSAVGYPLTFRAVITSGEVIINLDYPVQVAR